MTRPLPIAPNRIASTPQRDLGSIPSARITATHQAMGQNSRGGPRSITREGEMDEMSRIRRAGQDAIAAVLRPMAFRNTEWTDAKSLIGRVCAFAQNPIVIMLNGKSLIPHGRPDAKSDLFSSRMVPGLGKPRSPLSSPHRKNAVQVTP